MLHILLLVNLFISLNEIKRTFIKKSNERTHIPLFSNLFIYLIELEHPLKTSNKGTHVKFKIDKISY